MLKENTLYGYRDKVQEAIDRIKLLEAEALRNNSKGYVVCDSGGKDSSVIKEIAKLSGVKYEIAHHITTVDHPETMKFLHSEKKRHECEGISYTMGKPRESMFKMIEYYGAPTRKIRWCCKVFKEGHHLDRFSVLGIRKSESIRRRNNRSAFEFGTYKKDLRCVETIEDAQDISIWHCFKDGRERINPIIDWSDSDVYEFIQTFKIPLNPLYEQGFKRVGCVGCPMSSHAKKELDLLPQFKNGYIRAFQRYLDLHPRKNIHFSTGDDLYHWWVGSYPIPKPIEGQVSMFTQGQEPSQT